VTQPKNAFEIFKLLDKSNCGLCGEKTCLAFAGAVFTGRRPLEECPQLAPEVRARFAGKPPAWKAAEKEGIEYLEELKSRVAAIDLAAAAARIGAGFDGDKLTLKVLGKDFGVDTRGRIYADIHVNPWVAVPFINHILSGRGLVPTGRWVSFRELKEGRERYQLFHKRSEAAMQRVADAYTPLFDDMVHLFGGRQVERQFASDVSVVLHPLPRVPIMVCYWAAEEGMGSSLNLYFDETADANLDIGSLFSLGVGLAQMFTKIALRHGVNAERPAGPPDG
jgi:hypothetical protein